VCFSSSKMWWFAGIGMQRTNGRRRGERKGASRIGASVYLVKGGGRQQGRWAGNQLWKVYRRKRQGQKVPCKRQEQKMRVKQVGRGGRTACEWQSTAGRMEGLLTEREVEQRRRWRAEWAVHGRSA